METDTHTTESSPHLMRQSTLIPQESLNIPVHIIGCGAIGSFTALALAKMGVTNISVYDMDKVDVVNMNCQFYRFKDIGKDKAVALAELVEDFTGVELMPNVMKVDKTHAARLKGTVIFAVDSIEARSEIFYAIKDIGVGVDWLIDTRMGAEYYEQHCLNPYDKEETRKYVQTFHEPGSTAQAPCTAKSTVYTATLAAGMVSKTVKNIITKQDYPREVHWAIASCIEPMAMTLGKSLAHTEPRRQWVTGQTMWA